MGSYTASPMSHDLDGLNFAQPFNSADRFDADLDFDNGFGFDPSPIEQTYQAPDTLSLRGFTINPSPNESGLLNAWTGFHAGNLPQMPMQLRANKSTFQSQQPGLGNMPQMMHQVPPKLITANLPSTASVLSHYGRVTPPRSASVTSEQLALERVQSEQPSNSSSKKRRGKAQLKSPLSPPDSATARSKLHKTPGRKRSSVVSIQPGSADDEKRKASLEKNRVAAAKCRINKKEKTEQLQRDSHAKAKENADLSTYRDGLEMELQTLMAYASAHVNCSDCNGLEELKATLHTLQENHLRKQLAEFAEGSVSMNSPTLSNSGQSMVSSRLSRSTHSPPSTSHPPLPEFNMTGDFEVNTPLAIH